MKKLIVALAICLFTFGMANAQDPGIQDSIIIRHTDAPLGTDTIHVWAYVVTDDSVAVYNMPFTFTSNEPGIQFEHVTYFPPLIFWDDVFDTLVASQNFVRMIGWFDTGGPDNPPMHTNGNRVHAWNLVFSVEDTAPTQVVSIDTTYDDINGSLYFGLVGGSVQFTPAFVPEEIWYGPVGIEDEISDIPTEFALNQNYPNPFNPQTNFSIDLPEAQDVSLVVYNILGQNVKTVAEGMYEAGSYTFNWNGKNSHGEDVPSGIYFYSLRTAEFSKTNKMMLIR
jgi:hypothetical protein